MNFDSFNVKARFPRAQALLINMGLSEEAKQNLLVAIQHEPYNEEIRDKLSRVEELFNISCNKVPTREIQAQILELDGEQDMKKTIPNFEDKVGGPLNKKRCLDSNNSEALVKMCDNEMQRSNVGICKETFSYTSIQTPALSNDPNSSVAIHDYEV